MSIASLASQCKITLLSSLGGMLEFYDFVIFAIFALPIGRAFFPNESPLLDVMSAFAAFAIGYLARPIGGMLFSHVGDRYGRRRTFLLTITLMGCATILMGVLPSYHHAGITMSVIFIALRVVQGVAVGGEIPGAMTFVSEHVQSFKGFACGVIFLFINLGIFLADGVNAILHATLSHTLFIEDAWRIAFIIGGLLAFLSYFLRTHLEETPEFLAFENKVVRFPLAELLKQHRRPLLAGVLIVSVQATLISLLYLYTRSFMQLTGLYSSAQISSITLLALMVFSIGCAGWGWLSDRLGSRRLLTIGMLLLVITSYLYYTAMLHAQLTLLAAVLVSVTASMITGAFGAYLTQLFPMVVRFSGVAFCYNIGFAIFGGLSPLLATYWIHASGDQLSPAYIVMIVCVLGLIGLRLSKRP